MINKQKILAYALENAIEHDGKAVINAVLNKLFQEGLKKEQIKSVIKDVQDEVNSVNLLSLEQQKQQFRPLEELVKKRDAQREGLPELENAEKGKVVMRFAPYPSGPLHIGNSRPAILNDEYVKMYSGKMLFVMDDTIGSEEKALVEDAYKLIPESLDWLEVKYQKPIIYKSNRLEIYYKYAEEIIKKDKAYVCFCSIEELRKNRENSKDCKCRYKEIDENLNDWKLMLSGKFKEGKATLRIKTSMQDKNPAFRDRVIFRISEREHPRTKKKYKIWPLLDFSWAIDDYLLDITHIIRGKELMMESEMERYIWKIFNWPQKTIIHSGLMQFEGIKISKSKGQKEVREGRYSGWDDPRLWSLQSLKKRGIKPEAIRKFIIGLGVNQNEITVPIDLLYEENKKLVEKSKRYFFVSEPEKIKVKNIPENKKGIIAKVPLHPSYPEMGNREIKAKDEFYITKDDEKKIKKGNFRLMHLFNVNKNLEFLSKEYDKGLNAIMIHWLPADKDNREDLIQAEIIMPDAKKISGLAEKDVKNVKVDEVIQFERFGFCRLDKKEKNKYTFYFSHK